MNETFKCRVSRVDTSTESLNPIIVEFQNGCVRPEAAKRLQCGVYEHKESKRRHIAVADDPSLYLGQELQDECCQTFLAIRNRKSNEVRLVVASKALLSPVLDQVDSNSHAVKEGFQTSMLDLARTFGSKKDRRAAEQIEKMSLNVDAVKDTLNLSASMISMSTDNIRFPEDSLLADLPPCNRDAKISSDIYNIKDLIGEAELSELSGEAERILEAGESEITSEGNYSYSALFKFLFKPILSQIQASKEAKVRNLACLLYMEFILQLLRTHPKQFSRPDFELCSVAPITNQTILEKFINKRAKGWVMPAEKQDTAICYIMLIGLLLSVKYKIPLDILTEAMHCKSQRLVVLCQSVGVTVLTESNFKMAMLTVPVPGPKREVSVMDMVKQKNKQPKKR